ncbi:MAG: M20/M25/M40 family metallo-hydrolase [Anaerolineae bacterium]|nr:M20/M25/M40 family metallo-hydrolase [Anaerolineae bacterium]
MHPAIQQLAHSAALVSIRHHLDVQRIVRDAVAVQQIPAPTFQEGARAAFVKERFARYPLQNIRVDDLHNVYGRWVGARPDGPALLVSAHTDTVFSMETDLRTRHKGERLYGPGLGDNSLGVAALLALLDIFQAHALRPAADIWFVANSREEGLGDLGGIRAVWKILGERLGAAVVIEGMALGCVYHAGIAVRRLHVTCHAPGGHSWHHFGQPSAIHGLVQLGERIITITPPRQPRTTYNIGLIEGGQSVNSLATSAEIYLDLRSEDPDTLAALEQRIMSDIDDLRRPGLDFTVDVVGDRPAGQIPADHPLVQLAMSALETVGIEGVHENGSTDANALLANGLPTVTTGITYGGHAHRPDEFIEIPPISDGIWQLVLLVLAAAGQLRTWAGLAG